MPLLSNEAAAKITIALYIKNYIQWNTNLPIQLIYLFIYSYIQN